MSKITKLLANGTCPLVYPVRPLGKLNWDKLSCVANLAYVLCTCTTHLTTQQCISGRRREGVRHSLQLYWWVGCVRQCLLCQSREWGGDNEATQCKCRREYLSTHCDDGHGKVTGDFCSREGRTRHVEWGLRKMHVTSWTTMKMVSVVAGQWTLY